MTILQPFAPVFSERIWDWVQVLVIGAILAPKQRTVTAILRIMGLSGERQFQNYHRVLNRACWSGLRLSQMMLGLLVVAFLPPDAPVILAADETLERRRGKQIAAKGHFRNAMLSSEKKHIASEGLRWVSMMLLVPVPWSRRVWALPFLTVLAPHEKTHAALGQRHKTSIDWVQQLTSQVRRWLPARRLILLTDGGLIAVKLGLRCRHDRTPVTFISRLHLNIRLFDPPTPKPSANPNRCRSAGCWCVIPSTSSSPRPSAAPISRSARNRSLPSMCCAGTSKSPLKSAALISALRPSVNGAAWQLPAPPHPARLFLAGGAVGPAVAGRPDAADPLDGLVHETRSYLRRCDRLRPPLPVATSEIPQRPAKHPVCRISSFRSRSSRGHSLLWLLKLDKVELFGVGG